LGGKCSNTSAMDKKPGKKDGGKALLEMDETTLCGGGNCLVCVNILRPTPLLLLPCRCGNCLVCVNMLGSTPKRRGVLPLPFRCGTALTSKRSEANVYK
jgi:hypothetical protein